MLHDYNIVVEAAVSASAAPLERMVADESRRRLWDRAAEVLSEEQSTALWLHYVEEMPAREIARARPKPPVVARAEGDPRSESPSIASK